MEKKIEQADQRIMDKTTVRLEGRQLKASNGAGSRVSDVPLWEVRARLRARPALAVYGD